MKRPTLKPSDLRAEAQRLIKAGKMPTLDQLLEAVFEVRSDPHPHTMPIADFDEDADTLLVRNRRGGSQ
jgi:hypothetical protein